MRDYIKRFLIAGILALCVGLLFAGGTHTKASILNNKEQKVEWIWPADGVISDTFGTRQGKHKGIDIAGKINSPVFAVDDGTVEKSYYSDSYGNVIFIQHQNKYVTVYGHLNSRLVSEGQRVKKGDIIGKMGRTGQATGVHLHFETHQTEWTYEKKFALNPEGLLGSKKLGEIVQAGIGGHEEKVMEASSRLNDQGYDKGNMLENNSGPHELFYIVKDGDTLWSIAKAYNLTVEKIQEINKLDGETQIIPGENLIIKKEAENQYIVQKGDTLSSISVKTHVSVEEIRKINHLSSDVLMPKQILNIQKIK